VPGTRLGVIPAAALAAALLVPSCALLHRHPPSTPPPVDLNSGALRKIERLPGITPSMARRIVEGRPYRTADELVDRGLLTPRELERIRDQITIAPPER
jgi:DNA uptake protein ComE-like DNA-binding protein